MYCRVNSLVNHPSELAGKNVTVQLQPDDAGRLE